MSFPVDQTITLHLDSSEETPSTHASLYDARPSGRLTSSLGFQSSENTASSPGSEVDGSKSPRPTRADHLFTIVEQKSVHTLSKASNTTLSKRIIGLQQQPSVEHGLQRRLCFSLDEKALSGFQPSNTNHSSHPRSRLSSDLSANDPLLRECIDMSKPAQPPFPPPERSKTPETMNNSPLDPETGPTRRSISGGMLGRFKRTVASRLGRKRPQQSAAEVAEGTVWRAPLSGHSTFRYNNVETHPFNFTGVASPSVTVPDPEPHRSGTDTTEAQATQGNGKDANTGYAHAEIPLTHSQQALSAIRSNAIPVSAERLEAAQARRSSSLPRSRTRQSSSLSNQRPESFPNGTVRTIDLIQAFPPPPRAISEPTRRPRTFSLFPAIAEPGLTEQSGNNPTSPAASPDRKARKEYLQQLVTNAMRRRQGVAQPEPSCSGALPAVNDGHRQAAETSAPRTSFIRGEENANYRLSGRPIYTPETASLRSEDGQDEDAGSHRSSNSYRTGVSRYFSATSQPDPARQPSHTSLVPTPPETPSARQSFAEKRRQHDRATANGALRFTSSGESQPRLIQTQGDGIGHENIVPVTITSHGRKCSHQLRKQSRS